MTIARGVALLRYPSALELPGPAFLFTGYGERRFFGWAYRDPSVRVLFERIEPSLREGEIVLLLVPPGRYDTAWLHGIALYFLPHQNILGVIERREGEPRPRVPTIVSIDARGEFEVFRRPDPRSSR